MDCSCCRQFVRAIELVVREGMLEFVAINKMKRAKLKRVGQFLHHVEVDESSPESAP